MQENRLAVSSLVLGLALAPAALLAAPITVRGVVFDDRNNDGIRQANEPGLAGVGVSDQHAVVSTASDGTYELATDTDAAFVSVTTPDGWRSRGLFWRPLSGGANQSQPDRPPIDFALTRGSASRSFTFIHASDTHLSEASLPRIRRLREMVAAAHPDFVLLTGDLVKDALRVTEPIARGYYEMVVAELA
ncbi:MAG: metallophosphoesterase N-terminal domain-containing protein, partial [Acidobacteriota bacterium]